MGGHLIHKYSQIIIPHSRVTNRKLQITNHLFNFRLSEVSAPREGIRLVPDLQDLQDLHDFFLSSVFGLPSSVFVISDSRLQITNHQLKGEFLFCMNFREAFFLFI